MNTNPEINFGINLIEQQKQNLQKIKSFLQTPYSPEAVKFLLELENDRIEQQINENEKRLKNLKLKTILQFEQDSAICNMNIDGLINDCEKFIGKEPLAITEKLEPLINDYHDDLEQYQKNDIFAKLNFLLKQIKSIK